MQCEEFRGVLPDLRLKNVEPGKATEAKSHASACKECGARLAAERDLDVAISAAAMTVVPPAGAAAAARRAMIGGPAPAAKFIATAAAVLLLTGAGLLPFLLSGDASAAALLERAAELHTLEAVKAPGRCCGTFEQLGVPQPSPGDSPERIRLLAARHGWRLADAVPTRRWSSGVRLSFRKRSILLTCLMVPDKGYELSGPARKANNHTYHVYRTADLTHIVQRLPDGRLCVLTANTDEKTLADLVLSADAGRATATDDESLTPITWTISGMECDRCGGVVKATLEGVDGVARVRVDRSIGATTADRVRIWLSARVRDRDSAPVLDAAAAALGDAGFQVVAR